MRYTDQYYRQRSILAGARRSTSGQLPTQHSGSSSPHGGEKVAILAPIPTFELRRAASMSTAPTTKPASSSSTTTSSLHKSPALLSRRNWMQARAAAQRAEARERAIADAARIAMEVRAAEEEAASKAEAAEKAARYAARAKAARESQAKKAAEEAAARAKAQEAAAAAILYKRLSLPAAVAAEGCPPVVPPESAATRLARLRRSVTNRREVALKERESASSHEGTEWMAAKQRALASTLISMSTRWNAVRQTANASATNVGSAEAAAARAGAEAADAFAAHQAEAVCVASKVAEASAHNEAEARRVESEALAMAEAAAALAAIAEQTAAKTRAATQAAYYGQAQVVAKVGLAEEEGSEAATSAITVGERRASRKPEPALRSFFAKSMRLPRPAKAAPESRLEALTLDDAAATEGASSSSVRPTRVATCTTAEDAVTMLSSKAVAEAEDTEAACAAACAAVAAKESAVREAKRTAKAAVVAAATVVAAALARTDAEAALLNARTASERAAVNAAAHRAAANEAVFSLAAFEAEQSARDIAVSQRDAALEDAWAAAKTKAEVPLPGLLTKVACHNPALKPQLIGLVADSAAGWMEKKRRINAMLSCTVDVEVGATMDGDQQARTEDFLSPWDVSELD